MPPAIALTGYAEPEHKTALMQLGFAAVIAKPYRIDELLAVLAQTAEAQPEITSG